MDWRNANPAFAKPTAARSMAPTPSSPLAGTLELGGSTALSLCAAGAEVVVSPTGIACGGGVSMTGFGLPGTPSGGFQFLFDIH